MKMKFWTLAALFMCGALVSCSDDDSNEIVDPDVKPEDSASAYVVAGTVGSEAAYIITPESLNEGSTTAKGNGYETSYASSATWVFYGDKYLYRLAYNQGSAGNTAAFHLDSNGKIQERSNHYTIQNFTAYGIYNNKIIATGTGETTEKDAAGNAAYGINFSIIDVDNQTVGTKTIPAEDFVGTKEYVMLAGLEQANGKIYAGVVPLGCSPYGVAAGAVLPGNEDLVAKEDGGTGGGSYKKGSLSGTQYPDECYVAIFDDDTFENYTIVKTDKMSWAAGRMRAAYYQMVWAADNGDVYVFSSSYAKLETGTQKTSHPSSIMRIKAGAKEFDSTYEPFDIEAVSGGNEVYRSWHITGDYFLLQMYTQGVNIRGTGTTRMAIYKGEDRKFTYVTGLPAEDQISSFSVKNPYKEDGVCYIAVSTAESRRVYKIDPVTATATPGLTVDIDELGAIGKLVATEN